MSTDEARQKIQEEGYADETGGAYGLEEMDEIAIRAMEPADDPAGFADFWADVKEIHKLIINQRADIVTGTVVGVKIDRLGG